MVPRGIKHKMSNLAQGVCSHSIFYKCKWLFPFKIWILLKRLNLFSIVTVRDMSGSPSTLVPYWNNLPSVCLGGFSIVSLSPLEVSHNRGVFINGGLWAYMFCTDVQTVWAALCLCLENQRVSEIGTGTMVVPYTVTVPLSSTCSVLEGEEGLRI